MSEDIRGEGGAAEDGLLSSQLLLPLPTWAMPGCMPGGGQSRAETWSLLSDSTMDTRYSGKKWPAPTGETWPDPTICNCLFWRGQKGLSSGLGRVGQGHPAFFLLTNYSLFSRSQRGRCPSLTSSILGMGGQAWGVVSQHACSLVLPLLD